jgi:hypothetical protein
LDLERITGLSLRQLDELTRQIRILMGDVVKPGGRPAAVGLTWSVAIVVYLLRHNVTQDVAGATFDVSQSTVSRRWDKLRRVIGATLHSFIPDPARQIGRGTVLVDGTLAPTWNWKSATDMYSGKHKKAGFNIQVACDLGGRVAAIGKNPVPGARHDAHALYASGLADQISNLHRLGDSGYQSHADITPDKKPKGGELTKNQKENNKEISSIRAAVERAIAHVKIWRICSSRYRGPLEKFAEVLAAVIGLHFFIRAYE